METFGPFSAPAFSGVEATFPFGGVDLSAACSGGFCSGVSGSAFTGSLTGACSGGLSDPVSGVAVSGAFVVLSSGIHVYLLILGMKKGACLFINIVRA